MFAYCMHRSKCQKFNSLHKLKHHRKIAWYYKANFMTNSPRLEIQKEESCTHSFNYKDDYQVDNINCLFWKYRFNRN